MITATTRAHSSVSGNGITLITLIVAYSDPILKVNPTKLTDSPGSYFWMTLISEIAEIHFDEWCDVNFQLTIWTPTYTGLSQILMKTSPDSALKLGVRTRLLTVHQTVTFHQKLLPVFYLDYESRYIKVCRMYAEIERDVHWSGEHS